jgi:hypothetical protein
VDSHIERALGRIEGKLDLLIPALTANEERTGIAEVRISKLEKFQSKLLGGAVVAGFVFGLIMRALEI